MPLALTASALFAAWLTLHYGRRGFMPLDQSVVFDGGLRTLHGQVPFRDYVTPDGVPSFAVQALFFALTGVTWLSVCVHAAVFDALFVLLSYALLRLVEVPVALALPAAALGSVVFYPPFGTAFMDQDAFLFLLAAVTAAAGALRSRRRFLRRVCWTAAPTLVLAAALTKPIPGVLAAPLTLLLVATTPRGRIREAFVWLAAGTVGVLALTVTALAAAGADGSLAWLSLVDLPRSVGNERESQLLLPRLYVQRWGLLTPLLVYPLAFASAAGCVRVGGLRRASAAARQLVLGVGLFLTCELYCALTRNDRQNGVCFLFLSVALLATPLAVRLRPRLPVAALATGGAILLALTLTDVVRFNRDVNATRLVQDMSFREPTSAEQRAVPSELSYLRWDLPSRYRYTPGELRRLADDLRRAAGNFVLVGDTTILYALAHRPSAFPTPFFDPGESYPGPGHAGRIGFERLLARTLRERNVHRVVLEGASTWTGSTIADFPVLARAVRSDACGRRRYGEFTVVELCRPFGHDSLP